MCLTIPAKVVEISENKAKIDKDGQEFEIDIRSIPDLSIGDWVLYMSDIAVQKVSPDDAKEILELLEHVDKTDPSKLEPRFIETIKASKQRKLNKSELEYLLNLDGLDKEALFSEAEMMRKALIKDFFCIHGIIEFSNYCTQDCAYCGLRCENTALRRLTVCDAQRFAHQTESFRQLYPNFLLVFLSSFHLLCCDPDCRLVALEIHFNKNIINAGGFCCNSDPIPSRLPIWRNACSVDT